jgi:hypothetical protein
MRNYITEKMKKTPRHFINGTIKVDEIDPIPDEINIDAIFLALEKNLPPHYFTGIEGVKIQHLPEFDDREVNALYQDKKFYITNRQNGTKDLLDDLVHEFAHHMETIFPELIYSDQGLIREFLRKRQELNFELRTEGYWTNEYDFDNLKYDESFDKFLYKRVGKNMLRLATSGMFIRPYAAVSLREYFATGFEAYYLGKQNTLEKISPILYDKITELHNVNSLR